MIEAEIEQRFRAAEAIVCEAGALALEMRAKPDRLGVVAKSARDFVTAADQALERLIVERITAAFGDAVLGEEFGGAEAERLWIVDPIDGTYNYIHGSPRWGVSLGFVVAGEPLIGIVYNPAREEMYAARRACGATLNGRRITVSGRRYLDQPLVEVGCSNRRPLELYLDTLRRLMEAGIETRRCGSGALGLAQVAAGTTDAYCEAHINSWDVAAGIVLVREAGGWVNDFFAGGGVLAGNPILACTPELRERLSELTGIGA